MTKQILNYPKSTLQIVGKLKEGLEKHTKSTFFTYSQVFIKPGSKLNNSYYSKASYLV